MDTEQLIEIVKEYKYLYDLTDKKYSDNQKKDQAWNEIGIKLKSNGTKCKKTWALLRDSFRRSIKKRKYTKGGQASIPDKKWKYEDEMSFLLPYMKERPTICPIPTLQAFDDDNANDEENIARLLEVGQQMTDTTPSTPEVSQQMGGTLLTTPSPSTSENYPQPKRTKRGQKRTEESPSIVLMKYIIDSKKNTPPPDDIEQFMAGITTTLRSFPPRDRAIAKAKIFEIVSRMEIDRYSEQAIHK